MFYNMISGSPNIENFNGICLLFLRGKTILFYAVILLVSFKPILLHNATVFRFGGEALLNLINNGEHK